MVFHVSWRFDLQEGLIILKIYRCSKSPWANQKLLFSFHFDFAFSLMWSPSIVFKFCYYLLRLLFAFPPRQCELVQKNVEMAAPVRTASVFVCLVTEEASAKSDVSDNNKDHQYMWPLTSKPTSCHHVLFSTFIASNWKYWIVIILHFKDTYSISSIKSSCWLCLVWSRKETIINELISKQVLMW